MRMRGPRRASKGGRARKVHRARRAITVHPGPGNLTYVEETVAVASGLTSSAYAPCPAGMVVTGGGEFTDKFDTTGLNVTDSDWAPSTLDGPPTRWFATIHNGGAILLNFTVTAICTHPTTITQAPASAGATKR